MGVDAGPGVGLELEKSRAQHRAQALAADAHARGSSGSLPGTCDAITEQRLAVIRKEQALLSSQFWGRNVCTKARALVAPGDGEDHVLAKGKSSQTQSCWPF